jgi:hypothetical protein
VRTEVAHGNSLEQLRGFEEAAGNLGQLCQVLSKGKSHNLFVGSVKLGKGGQDVFGEDV